MTLTAVKPQVKIWQEATPEAEVGDVIRKPFAPIARVVGKEILNDGRTCLIVNFPGCHDRHTEEWVVGNAVPVEELIEVEAPIAKEENSVPAVAKPALKKLLLSIVQVKRITSDISATKFDRTKLEIAAKQSLELGGFYNPPVVKRDGDSYKIINGDFEYHAAAIARQLDPKAGETIPAFIVDGVLPVAAPVPQVPHAKTDDDGFMAAMVRESEFDRDFLNLAYLSECELQAQLAVEATEIGSEEEKTAYRKLREIECKIKTYGMHSDKCKVPEIETVAEEQRPATAGGKVMTEVQAQTIVGVSAMNESNDAIVRALPYPQPRFWFGDRVSFSCSWSSPEDVIECYWSEGFVTGMNWNPESEEWKYLIYWEESSDETALLGYDNDRLLMSERDLVACP